MKTDLAVPAVPLLARGGLERAAHRRLDDEWQREAWERARVVVIDDGRVLVRDGALVLVDAAAAAAGERYFLGLDVDETPYFAVAGELPTVDGGQPATLRDIGDRLSDFEAALMVTAVSLVNWHLRHPYSPLSGKLTMVGESGWTRVTDDGAETMWPRTDPAVIVLVHDGVAGPAGRCLLGHNAAWTAAGWARRYSCLAGFVEPGESAEAAVVREVAEEVGVSLREIRYVASQPWPFPGSLMLGFFALADPAAGLHLDQTEITDARWFTREEIAAVLTGRSSEFGLPMAASIASFLIRLWCAGQA
jgi:NAD+ diphosphatase